MDACTTQSARRTTGAGPGRGVISARAMFPLMLVDTPDDRYRGGRPGPPWRRVLRLLAGAVACFLVGALDIGAVVFVLLALCALDD
jgi:hypothetical protein